MPTTLWDFSLETYRRPGVEEACWKLQDELGADVNMLFYCCWRGEFVAGEMGALLAVLAPWQDGVVCGLRFHDLRHEATSRFFEKGLNVMEVAALTGPRNLRMLQRYTHLKAEDLAAKLA